MSVKIVENVVPFVHLKAQRFATLVHTYIVETASIWRSILSTRHHSGRGGYGKVSIPPYSRLRSFPKLVSTAAIMFSFD